MSYMSQNPAFEPVGGIRELSINEIEGVGGGLAPLVVAVGAAVVKCAASTPCRTAAQVTAVAVAGAVAAAVGYENNRV